MKTRAAVAFEAKKPLEIVELDLEGLLQPRIGRHDRALRVALEVTVSLDSGVFMSQGRYL